MKSTGGAKRLVGRLPAVTLAGAALALGAGGCSFLFVSGPPPMHEKMTSFDCTSSAIVPVLETVFASAMAGVLLTSIARDDSEYASRTYTRQEDITYSSIYLGLFGGSAIVGYARTSACRSAKARLALRPVPVQLYPPSPYPPNPYPPSPYPPTFNQPPPADPWAPPPPPYAPPAAPAPAPAPPAAPAPSPAPPPADAAPPAARLVPRLHVDRLAFAGRLGRLPLNLDSALFGLKEQGTPGIPGSGRPSPR